MSCFDITRHFDNSISSSSSCNILHLHNFIHSFQLRQKSLLYCNKINRTRPIFKDKKLIQVKYNFTGLLILAFSSTYGLRHVYPITKLLKKFIQAFNNDIAETI